MYADFAGCLAEGGLSTLGIEQDDSVADVLGSIQEQVDDESPEFASALVCIDNYRLLYPDGVLPL
jgi:hypothetical protein